MATADERRALTFLAALALLAGAVRFVGVRRFDRDVRAAAGGAPPADVAGRALANQIAAVDSARRAPRKRKSTPGPAKKSGRRRSPPAAAPVSASPTRVDVNHASAEELERLPRVGPALAKRIVEWRSRHGPFRQSDDLRHVRGIGRSTVRFLDSMVTFSGWPRPLDNARAPVPEDHIPSVS